MQLREAAPHTVGIASRQQQLRDLHRDRRRALDDPAFGQVRPERTDDRHGIHAPMGVVASVFGGERGRDERWRQLVG
jgi:hypothetical protein